MRIFPLVLSFILLITVSASAQQQFKLSGNAKACYAGNYDFSTSNIYLNLILQSPDNKVKYFTSVNSKGDFIFENVLAGTYHLSGSSLEFNQKNENTIIVVNQEIQNISFCFDRAYRPAPNDSLIYYKFKAKEDIKQGRAKIYEWTPWSLTSDPFAKVNSRIKKKFGFEYEMKSCLREESRSEILHTMFWTAYNGVVYQYLNEKFGKSWRFKIKHEREKLLKEKLHTT